MSQRVVDTGVPSSVRPEARDGSALALHWASVTLVGTVWVSAALFGLYILAFYAGAVLDRDMERWNSVLPRLYEPSHPGATSSIALHFAAGGVILILGCIQLLDVIRSRFPALHRWLGRVYVAASLLAAVGGLASIILKGTVGGPVMDIGFGLYGVLMLVAAVQTYRYARARQLEAHRAWSLRLFALAIGSWLYRMDYGFWLLLTDGWGHTVDFRGPFDMVMAFFFYLPNLVVVELFIRARRRRGGPALRFAAAAVLLAATCFVLLGTYFFTVYLWGPAIIQQVWG